MNQKEQMKHLEAWSKDIENEIQDIVNAMTPLKEQLSSAQEKLELIHRLMRLAEKDLLGHDVSLSLEIETVEQILPLENTQQHKKVNIESHLKQMLEKSGEPMHIKELRQALISKGIPLPGRGDEANIILRLRRAGSTFTRTGRGMYGLSTWGLPEVKPITRKRTVKKKAKRKQ